MKNPSPQPNNQPSQSISIRLNIEVHQLDKNRPLGPQINRLTQDRANPTPTPTPTRNQGASASASQDSTQVPPTESLFPASAPTPRPKPEGSIDRKHLDQLIQLADADADARKTSAKTGEAPDIEITLVLFA